MLTQEGERGAAGPEEARQGEVARYGRVEKDEEGALVCMGSRVRNGEAMAGGREGVEMGRKGGNRPLAGYGGHGQGGGGRDRARQGKGGRVLKGRGGDVGRRKDKTGRGISGLRQGEVD